MRLAATVAIVSCVMVARETALTTRISPPNSLEPRDTLASVQVRHTHRTVASCEALPHYDDPRCAPTFEKRDATTAFRLEPLKARKVTQRNDVREPINVSVRSDGTPEGDAVRIAPGTWELIWQGLQSRKRFSAAPRGVVDLELETISGRCERVVGQCVLHHDTTSRTANVTIR